MATRSGALPGAINADLYDDPRVIKAQLEALESRIMEFGDLETEEESLIRYQAMAQANHLAVVARVQPEIDILSQLQPPLTASKQAQLDALHSEVVQSQAKIDGIAADLATVRSDKEVLAHLYQSRERRQEQLERSLAKAKPIEPKVEPVAAAVATPAPAAESPAAPKASERKSDEAELRTLGYTPLVIDSLSDKERQRIIFDELRYEDYRKANPSFVTTPTAAKPKAKATATARSGGFPVWVMGLIAIALIAVLIFGLCGLTTNKITPATSQTTAAPTVQAMGAAPAISNMRSNPIDRNQRRYEIETSVPTTARLIDINADKVMAESGTPAKSHSLVFTVPEFSGLEKTFRLKLEAKGADGQLAVFGPIEVTVLQNSRGAGGVASSRELVAYLKEPQSGADRDALVSLIKAVSPNYPGVAGLTSANLVSFVESNLSRFEVLTLTAPLSGEFAYVRADGSSGYSPVTLATGTPVLTFDGKVLASALCVNEVKQPTPTVTTVPTPTPTPRGGFQIIKFWDLNGNGVRDAGESGLGSVRFSLTIGGAAATCLTTGDGTGNCSYGDLIAGTTVIVTETVPEGWVATTTTARTITIVAGQTQTVWFGNRQVTSVTTTPVPTPVPTPAPTPVPTKNPSAAPSAPPPPPASMTPPPTQSPWVALGTVMVTESTSCGAGCWKLTWNSAQTAGGFVLYGLSGYSRSNRVDGYTIGTDTYTATLSNLEAGRTYEFQAFAYPRDGSTPYRSAVMTFTAR